MTIRSLSSLNCVGPSPSRPYPPPSPCLSSCANTGFSRVTIRGVASLALSPLAVADPSSLPAGAPAGAVPRSLLCAFVPEIKGSPAFAGLYDFSGAAPGTTLEPSTLVKKAFFRTSGARVLQHVLYSLLHYIMYDLRVVGPRVCQGLEAKIHKVLAFFQGPF